MAPTTPKVAVESSAPHIPSVEVVSSSEPYWKDHVTEILFSEQRIKQKVQELAAQITEEYKGKDLIVVGLLNGALPFLTDLARAINLPVVLDTIKVKSYSGTKSTGTIKLVKPMSEDVTGKHVLIAEDLIDTGRTLRWLVEHFKTKDAASVKLCCLLDKVTNNRVENVPLDFYGFKCPDEFVIGYGMDYDETYRNMPCVAVLHPKMYMSPEDAEIAVKRSERERMSLAAGNMSLSESVERMSISRCN